MVEAPDGFHHLLGRRVLPLQGEGTWQTEVDCPVSSAIEVPDEIPDLIAARAYINPLAAFVMLRLWPVRDKTVLLSAAGSSCAEYLGRWAIRQGARRVIGIYRSETRVDRLRRIGIEPISISDNDAISAAAKGAHIAFDALGGDIARHMLASMPKGACFVAYGLLTGQPVFVQAGTRATYHRFHLRDHLASLGPKGMRKAFAEIWPRLVAEPPEGAEILSARDWREALTAFEKPGGQKPVLEMTGLG